MITLYKRNAQGKPLVWQIGPSIDEVKTIVVRYGLVGGTLHREEIKITAKNSNEVVSRINAKRKEGYKEISELKDGVSDRNLMADDNVLKSFLNTYLPKYSTTSEGFVLPMLAKVLEDNKPFEKYGTMLGQWKIDGLRCIIGATDKSDDLFNPITLTYHSRTGEDWTTKMCWMDEILLPKISKELLSMMIEEGACLDGELYLPGYSVNDINSFVKNTQLANHYKLQYWCYDICCENMSAEARRNFRFDNIKYNHSNFEIHSKEEHLNNKEQFILLQSWDVESITDATVKVLFFVILLLNISLVNVIKLCLSLRKLMMVNLLSSILLLNINVVTFLYLFFGMILMMNYLNVVLINLKMFNVKY